jgi:DNA-binding CsgD family transcriptional regulator
VSVDVSTSQLRAVLEVAELAAHARTMEIIVTGVLPAVCAVIGASGAVYHQIDLRGSQEIDLVWPSSLFQAQPLASYGATIASHPFVQQLQIASDLDYLRLSDLVSRRQWRATPVYGDGLKHLGVEEQMAVTWGRVAGWAHGLSVFTDGRSFADHQRELMRLLAPHVKAAINRARQDNPRYRALVIKPEPHWVEHCDTVVTPFASTGGVLTAAEERVMRAAAQGLTSAQVGRRLGVRPATVDKHFEHIYGKLRVTNRVAAVRAFHNICQW